MRARNKVIIIIIIVVAYVLIPLDQSKPMSVSTEHCFPLDTNWGMVDRCIAETRLNEVLSANTLYWAIGGIIFVLVSVWLMLDRFKSELAKKNMNNNTKSQNDSDETIEELEKKIREIHDKKIDSFKPTAGLEPGIGRKRMKPVIIITISALCAAVAFVVIIILNPFGGGLDDMQNNFNGIPNTPIEQGDTYAKSESPFEIEAIYSDSGNVEISFLDTSGKTDSGILEILGLEEGYQKSFSGSQFTQNINFRDIPKYGWASHPVVLEIEHSELGHIQLKTEIHPLDEPIPPVIYSRP